MLALQTAVILITFVVFTFLIIKLFKTFNLKIKWAMYFLIPLIIFCLGFILRLTKVEDIISLGYFLTDFTSLFIYVLFAITFLLGQIHYWKKH